MEQANVSQEFCLVLYLIWSKVTSLKFEISMVFLDPFWWFYLNFFCVSLCLIFYWSWNFLPVNLSWNWFFVKNTFGFTFLMTSLCSCWWLLWIVDSANSDYYWEKVCFFEAFLVWALFSVCAEGVGEGESEVWSNIWIDLFWTFSSRVLDTVFCFWKEGKDNIFKTKD